MLGIHQQMKSGFLPHLTNDEQDVLVAQMKAAEKESRKKFWGRFFSQNQKAATKEVDNLHKKSEEDKGKEANRMAAYMDWVERETWRSMEVKFYNVLNFNL
jgi:hypothetical protein